MKFGKNRFYFIIICVLIAFAYFYLSSRRIINTMCFFRNITGLPCPGCGLTRAGLALFRGEIMQSLHYHPLLVPLVVIILLYLYSFFFYKRLYLFFSKNTIFWFLLGVIFIGAYLVRIFMYFPDIEPMNYEEKSFFYNLFLRNNI